MKKTILFLLTFLCFSNLYGESSNNDCYWYGRCAYTEFGNDGKPIIEKMKYVYPKGDDAVFEIQFDYSENYQNATVPVKINLNEIQDDKRVLSERIGILLKSIESTVNFKDDAIDIFTPDYQITVNSDGTILLYKTENSKYVSARVFENKKAEFLYSIRYKVLREKLMSINWGVR